MSDFDAKKTLVILLGAKEWPGCPSLEHCYPSDNNPFYNSVTAMEDYFRNVLGVDALNLRSWFDSKQAASTILEEIGEFITDRTSQTTVTDIFFYYIGHGDTGTTPNYCLLTRSSRANKLSSTAIQIRQLYEIVLTDAKNSRCYLILDACFSGAAYDDFPHHHNGIVLFHSSNKDENSGLTKEQDFSLFTKVLLTVLDEGSKECGEQLSFGDLGKLVQDSLDKIPSESVPYRCELHANLTSIEKIRIFKNPSYSSRSLIFLNPNSQWVIGVDVGTTNIHAGLVEIYKDPSRIPHVHHSKKVKHEETGKAELLAKSINNIVREILRECKITIDQLTRIGVGLPGQVDCTKGLLKYAPGLEIHNWDAVTELQNRLELEENIIFVDNDVNCSTLAELEWGYGSVHSRKVYKNFVCIYIGNGIGAGIVVNGQLVRGHNFAAGEVGHMKVASDENALMCRCGSKGCFEEYASARAITRLVGGKIRELRNKGNKTSPLVELDPDSATLPEDFVKIFNVSNIYCKELAEQIAKNLSIGIANIVNVLNPEVIILGGGIVDGFFKSNEFFKKTLIKYVDDGTLGVCRPNNILPTKLKDNTPILGAASLNEDNIK